MEGATGRSRVDLNGIEQRSVEIVGNATDSCCSCYSGANRELQRSMHTMGSKKGKCMSVVVVVIEMWLWLLLL